MTRHYLGIGSRGATVFRNVRRDESGEPLLFVDEDAITKLQINFTDYLETGETVSSAAVDQSTGCTVAIATSSPNVTLTLSAVTNGSVTLNVTMSNGEIYRIIIWVRRTNRYSNDVPRSDYV